MQQNVTGPNIVITESSSNLRALGRNALIGKWKTALIAVIIYELCIGVPPIILNELFGVNIGEVYYSAGYGSVYSDYGYAYQDMTSYSSLSGIYLLLVTGSLTLGLTLFFLAMFRRQKVEVTDIFLGFEKFGKALGLFLFSSLFIFLWSLLFIIPGIIASIRYSQAFYILADDPEKGIRQCMNESKRMMKGNCGKYFCLGLSFIGWILLSMVPAVIIDMIVTALYAPPLVSSLISMLTTMFVVPVLVYSYSTFTGFYEILAGHLIKETEPAPVEPQLTQTTAAPSDVSGDTTTTGNDVEKTAETDVTNTDVTKTPDTTPDAGDTGIEGTPVTGNSDDNDGTGEGRQDV